MIRPQSTIHCYLPYLCGTRPSSLEVICDLFSELVGGKENSELYVECLFIRQLATARILKIPVQNSKSISAHRYLAANLLQILIPTAFNPYAAGNEFDRYKKDAKKT